MRAGGEGSFVFAFRCLVWCNAQRDSAVPGQSINFLIIKFKWIETESQRTTPQQARTKFMIPPIPSPSEFKKGYRAFQKHEKRESMYRTATFLIDHFWGKPAEMADSLGVLLLTWNQAFYRYGIFDFDRLEKCISQNWQLLEKYRQSSILNYGPSDDKRVQQLFKEFLRALRIREGKKKDQKSPVAVAKALHLLGPDFFPLWDYKIAVAYKCRYSNDPKAKYLVFLRKANEMAEKLQTNVNAKAIGKTLLKLMDEFNYAKYTHRWI